MTTTNQVFTVRWGIVAAGWISGRFASDILLDPQTRGVKDVKHKLVAVGSRTKSKAEEFIKEMNAKDAKAYGSYEEVCNSSDVDVVYVGSPHTSHYADALMALEAGKHVLVEKPITVNIEQLKGLIEVAKKKNLFMMEALWTRFQPSALWLRELIDSGKLGPLRMLHADFSLGIDLEKKPKTHRLLNPDLGGGALLDLGPYPTFWAILSLYEDKRNRSAPPAGISASMLKTPLTGVDASTSFTLQFPNMEAQANLSCTMTAPWPEPSLIMRFQNAIITSPGPLPVPKQFTVRYYDLPTEGSKIDESRTEVKDFDWEGNGLHFQADEVARCVRDGKTESGLWGHDKSLVEMAIFDEVRKQGRYQFPEGIGKVKST